MRRFVPVLVAVPLVAFAFFRPGAQHPAGRIASDASSDRAGHSSGPGRFGPASRENVVYVAGQVRRPGLYRVESDARADDAVKLAGGMLPQADAAGVNLAERVADGDEIYVPAAGETVRGRSSRARSHRGARGRRHRRNADGDAAFSGSVDLNSADETELGAVPGIGPAIAARIVALRAQEGAFASLDELLDVAGMTPRRLEQARAYVYVSN